MGQKVWDASNGLLSLLDSVISFYNSYIWGIRPPILAKCKESRRLSLARSENVYQTLCGDQNLGPYIWYVQRWDLFFANLVKQDPGRAGQGRTVKQEQEEISPNHVQRLNLISVLYWIWSGLYRDSALFLPLPLSLIWGFCGKARPLRSLGGHGNSPWGAVSWWAI